jgi:hypothetical protein
LWLYEKYFSGATVEEIEIAVLDAYKTALIERWPWCPG